MSKNNYDYTSTKRQQRRTERLKESGLYNARIVCHRDDADKIREFAKKLYEKRGIKI